MMRLIGAGLLAGGSILMGLCAGKNLKRHTYDLSQMITGLGTIRRELNYRALSLPEVLLQAAGETDGNISLFFELASQGAAHLNGRTFQLIWEQTIEAGQAAMEQEDLVIVEQLGAVLGRYDAESQCQALDVAISRLDERRNAAEEQNRQMGRLYNVLSLTAGGFLLILFI